MVRFAFFIAESTSSGVFAFVFGFCSLLLCLFFVFVFCATAICTRASLGELKDKKIICEEFVKIFGLKIIACVPERKKCSWIKLPVFRSGKIAAEENCLCSGAERLQWIVS